MDKSKLKHYLYLTFHLPPGEAVRRAAKIIKETMRIPLERTKARWLGTHISDTEFWAAVTPELANREAFSNYLRSNEGHPAFFVDSAHSEALINHIEQQLPQAKAPTLAAAEQVCQHIFDLLGSGPTQLDQEIDWHFEFKSGHHYNRRQYYRDVKPAFYPGGADLKIPWELSRCQHFAWLGQAYWYTGDEKYTREFMAQVSGWIEQNPPQFGINWNCTMDVAIRAVNWLWGYHFFRRSPALNDDFMVEFQRSLLAHGRHIINNLEYFEQLTSNHYLSNVVGLVYLGILCPHLSEARQWRELGLQELWREMLKQVYPDGVDFEASISYHRMVTEFFLSSIVLCHLNNIPVPDEVMQRLEKMLEFTMHYTKPDGTIPQIGDSDNGRLHRLKAWAEPRREWLDHRYLLAVGAVLFNREDFGRAAADQWEEAFWLWGAKAAAFKARLDAPPLSLPSQAFPEGGLYVMRHDDDDDAYMIIDAGPNGQKGNGGHAHNDVLSFELYAGGQSWIVDPGTYLYTADFEARNLFRSTAYHNTVRVGRAEQNNFSPRLIFMMDENVTPAVIAWRTGQSYTLFVGEHNGYARLPHPVIHRRLIFFDHRARLWLMKDTLAGTGHYPCELFLHFAPGLEAAKSGETGLRVCNAAGQCLRVMPLAATPSTLTLQSGWVSYGFGQREEAAIAAWQWSNEADFEVALGLDDDREPFVDRINSTQDRLNQLSILDNHE